MTVPPLTWLYVPADRHDRVEKAIASAAHAVIVDLEDAVAPDAKDAARTGLAELLGEPREKRVLVRVNPLASPWGRADLESVAGLRGAAAISVPKVETPGDVAAVVAALPSGYAVHCLIESARGVEEAYAIASAPGVEGISLGEADLSADLGATGVGLDWARSRLVNAARAAGLPRPPQSVFTNLGDDNALYESCVHGRALGHLGRAAIHPSQLAVIARAYLPSAQEAEQAREIVDAFAAHESGAFAIAGRFVDVAIVRAAEETLAVADAYGTR